MTVYVILRSVFKRCGRVCAAASYIRYLLFAFFRAYTHYPGNFSRNTVAADRAAVHRRSVFHNRRGIRRTPCKAAAAAVCSGQNLGNFWNTFVLFNLKNLRRNRKQCAEHKTHTSDYQYGKQNYFHILSSFHTIATVEPQRSRPPKIRS